MSIVLSADIHAAMKELHDRLSGLEGKWLIGGSCNLMMQHVQLQAEPRDLDVYADQQHIPLIDQLLREYASDRPEYSETPIYRSILSHYKIAGVEIELVGDFTVVSAGSHYHVALQEQIAQYGVNYTIDHDSYRLMPLAHELIFNLLRHREDRYHPIADVMTRQIDAHIPALQAIIAGNTFDDTHIHQLNKLLNDRLLFNESEVSHD